MILDEQLASWSSACQLSWRWDGNVGDSDRDVIKGYLQSKTYYASIWYLPNTFKALRNGKNAFLPSGLQSWTRQELRWQNVSNLAFVIIVAKRMVDDMANPTHSHKGKTSLR